MGHAREAVEVAKTVVEVAELAWSTAEFIHHNKSNHPHTSSDELEDLRNENKRLKELLEQNLKLLDNISSSPCFLKDCPTDLHERLVTAVDSESFLTRLQSLREGSVNGTANEFPFKEPSGEDLEAVDILINVDQEEPSWWVWVTDSMVPGTSEERSGIDDESYVIICEEHVVDGVANFIARCIVSNPKLQKLTPEQLQKIVTSSLGGLNKVERMLSIWHAGKMFYALATWGLALAGLYQSRAVLKLAAQGVHHSSKFVLKAL
ncbi:uncharacterized protein LOC130810455 [Amaranthus tricolor]|uniref:uncharacterized protein LOC130810455 n=1 Tax=Amaranthus tricolor TaxID=29722 RepID=UPI002582A3A0|nr:uncharacterized protein LOC130810455 [Amaranthus tricolor]